MFITKLIQGDRCVDCINHRNVWFVDKYDLGRQQLAPRTRKSKCLEVRRAGQCIARPEEGNLMLSILESCKGSLSNVILRIFPVKGRGHPF